jgi:WD40 repeat protein
MLVLSATLFHKDPSISTLRGNAGAVYSLAFSRDGKYLAVGSGFTLSTGGDGRIRNVGRVTVWDVANRKADKTFADTNDMSAAVRHLAFSPSGDAMVTVSPNETLLWEVTRGELIRVLGSGSQCVQFSQDGRYVVSCNGCEVRRWNLEENSESVIPISEQGDAISAALDMSCSLLALGHENGAVALWDINEPRRIASLREHRERVTCVAFARDSSLLLSGSWDGTVRLWNLGGKISVETLCQAPSAVHCVALSLDDQMCAVGFQSGLIKVIDLVKREIMSSWTGHDDWIHAISFSPEGNLIASGCHGGTVKLWPVDMLTRR